MHFLEPQFQTFPGEAPGPPNKRLRSTPPPLPPLHVAATKPLHILLLALSPTYSKLFSFYFKFSGEPCYTCSFKIACVHRTKAQVICACSKENASVFRFFCRQHEHKKQNWQWIFLRFFCEFFLIWLSSNHMQFLQITLFLLKSVRANLIYLEKWQITEYWKNNLNNLNFLPIQNVRQYYFHDVAKYDKI